jgi:RNA polymerase primary sigma factor
MQENDILSDYLQSLYGIEPLTTDQEHDLARKIKKGDDDALEKLITHNLRFVVYIARQMSYWERSKIPPEDIIAIGNQALFECARKWKPRNRAKFATYAKSFIRRGIQREVDNTANIIRLPINIMEAIKRMNYNERALAQILGRKPKNKELAKIMGISESKVSQLQAYIAREPISIENLNQEKIEENDD